MRFPSPKNDMKLMTACNYMIYIDLCCLSLKTIEL